MNPKETAVPERPKAVRDQVGDFKVARMHVEARVQTTYLDDVMCLSQLKASNPLITAALSAKAC